MKTRSVGRNTVVRNLSCALQYALQCALPCALLLTTTAHAQPRTAPGVPAAEVPAAIREVGFDQKLDQMLPLDVPFTDENGRAVQIGEYFGQRPVVLSFVYYGCPMLCLQSPGSLASTLGVLSENPGEDFDVVSVSIDPPGFIIARARRATEMKL